MFLVMDTEVHEVFQVLMYVGGSCHGGLGVVGVDIELSLDRCSQLLHCGLQVLDLKLQCEILEDEFNYQLSIFRVDVDVGVGDQTDQFRGVRRLGNVQRTELLGLGERKVEQR